MRRAPFPRRTAPPSVVRGRAARDFVTGRALTGDEFLRGLFERFVRGETAWEEALVAWANHRPWARGLAFALEADGPFLHLTVTGDIPVIVTGMVWRRCGNLTKWTKRVGYGEAYRAVQAVLADPRTAAVSPVILDTNFYARGTPPPWEDLLRGRGTHSRSRGLWDDKRLRRIVDEKFAEVVPTIKQQLAAVRELQDPDPKHWPPFLF